MAVWDSSAEECLDLFFIFQPLHLGISELSHFHQFIYKQRGKLWFLLDTLRTLLPLSEVALEYKVELVKLVKVYQAVLSHLAVLDSPLVQSLRLSPRLLEQIRADPKTTNYFSAVS